MPCAFGGPVNVYALVFVANSQQRVVVAHPAGAAVW